MYEQLTFKKKLNEDLVNYVFKTITLIHITPAINFGIFRHSELEINFSRRDLYDKSMETTGTRVYSVIFIIFIKINIFPFSASILTFSTQNHLILTYFTPFDTTHFFC
jgi:hypothetical protein